MTQNDNYILDDSSSNSNGFNEYREDLIIPSDSDILEYKKISPELLQNSFYIKYRYNHIIAKLLNVN